MKSLRSSSLDISRTCSYDLVTISKKTSISSRRWRVYATDAPDDFRAQYLLGRCLFESGDAEGAVAALERAIKLAPDSLDSHFALHKAYARLGRADDARRELQIFSELERRRRERRSAGAPAGGPARP